MATHTGDSTLTHKCTEMIKLANIYLNHAPRHEKYGLCQEIRKNMYTVYDLITEARKKHTKKTTLRDLDIANEKLKMQWKLYHELGYFYYHHHKREKTDQEALKRYTAISSLVNEMGAMIGGWIKANDSKK